MNQSADGGTRKSQIGNFKRRAAPHTHHHPAVHTIPLRLSTVSIERMNQSADGGTRKSQIGNFKRRAAPHTHHHPAVHTIPLRLSTVSIERMNQFADLENRKAKLEIGNWKIANHQSPITNDSMIR
jgi:hypothetical protein